jgi:acetoacetyl-[acyl-carrier protein] synthase
MRKLPVIVSMGGINAAGRSSFHHGYKRMVHDALDDATMLSTWRDLARLMNLPSQEITPAIIQQIKDGTLIRRVESQHFDPSAVYYQRSVEMKNNNGFDFTVKKRNLPTRLPEGWAIVGEVDGMVQIKTQPEMNVLVPSTYSMEVSSAGQLPTGFDPGAFYHSKYHPRGLTMTVFGASDALHSMGMAWDTVLQHVNPDQVSVYSGTAVFQADEYGAGGLYQNPLNGGRISSKMMPLSLPEMSADFINSYIINSVGNTGTNVGACATFLYNLRQGVNDIQNGVARVALIGSTEAPVIPEIMEGFSIMGALATDKNLCLLDGVDQVDNRRACRPFSSNAGFTMAESAQFLIVMDDELAVQLGANILGSVADVFVNADANKKSIAGPGVGNYITMAKATGLARHILGDDGVNRTFVQAHGTGTPQNRVTESNILNTVAKSFGIKDWTVTGMKSYLGHSLGPAAADQLIPALGVWEYGYVPGIKTIDHIAIDVEQERLNILMDHHYAGEKGKDMLGSIINSKGFGGNNASALILSPTQTATMLEKRHGKAAMHQWRDRNEGVMEQAAAYDKKSIETGMEVIYKFGEEVMTEADVNITTDSLSLTRFANKVDLNFADAYKDFLA